MLYRINPGLLKLLNAGFFILTVLLLNASCKKSGLNEPEVPQPKKTIIYVTGSIAGPGGVKLPAYLKNDQLITLPVGTYTSGTARSVVVKGNDVYVSGDIENGTTGRAVLWKNGVLTVFPETEWPGRLFLAGNDIYMAGGSGAYWKNDVKVTVDPRAQTPGMYVNGTDVYLSGRLDGVNGYWKNGAFTAVPTAANSVQSIGVAGNDIYLLGQTSPSYICAYWKNGVPTVYSPGPGTNAFAFGRMVVDGSDFYFTGYEFAVRSGKHVEVAKYWKNGLPVMPETVSNIKDVDMSGGINNGYFRSIVVHNGDVYNVGMMSFDILWENEVVVLFKNKKQVTINPMLKEAWDLFVTTE
jgi:hypothetical protein